MSILIKLENIEYEVMCVFRYNYMYLFWIFFVLLYCIIVMVIWCLYFIIGFKILWIRYVMVFKSGLFYDVEIILVNF